MVTINGVERRRRVE
jgi:hypothetical protein